MVAGIAQTIGLLSGQDGIRLRHGENRAVFAVHRDHHQKARRERRAAGCDRPGPGPAVGRGRGAGDGGALGRSEARHRTGRDLATELGAESGGHLGDALQLGAGRRIGREQTLDLDALVGIELAEGISGQARVIAQVGCVHGLAPCEQSAAGVAAAASRVGARRARRVLMPMWIR